MKPIRSRIILLGVAAALGCTTGGPRSLAGSDGLPEPPKTASRGVFLDKCSRCHEPERGYEVIEDYREWVLIVARMSIKDRSWIAPEEVRQIIAYHGSYLGDGITLFTERCGECHTREELRGLDKSAGQWRTWIRFMAGRHGSEVTAEECELLLCSLTGQG